MEVFNRGAIFILVMVLFLHLPGFGQDSTENYIRKTVQLDEVVIRASRFDFNVDGFIRRVQTDTSFFKAFKTLRVIGFSAAHEIRFYDAGGKVKASLRAHTIQVLDSGCRHNVLVQQSSTGDFYTRRGRYRYYTAQMYGALFLSRDTVCGDDNIVNGGSDDIAAPTAGLERHIRQLEILIFNPGKEIPGIPIVGKKVALFDPRIAPHYDFFISSAPYRGSPCWVFTAKCKPQYASGSVIRELTTYFDTSTYRIVYRTYDLAYKDWLFDFKVQMEVRMTVFDGQEVPATIRYQGNWGVPINNRERADFDLELSDYNLGTPPVRLDVSPPNNPSTSGGQQ